MGKPGIPHRVITSHNDSTQNFDWIANHIYSGKGSPENVVPAGRGSLYLREDGGAATTLYVKESGVAKTGWVAK
jgi:hypothetical protein